MMFSTPGVTVVKMIPVLFLLCCLSGCQVTAILYPVKTTGPASPSAVGQPVIAKLKFTGAGKSGTISIIPAEGECFIGNYSFVEQNPKTLNKDILSAAWDNVYGPGYYVAHVLGTMHALVELKGDRGNTVLMDFYRTPGGEKMSQILGVAKDGNSNLYKVVF
jgi:hypothetical protein